MAEVVLDEAEVVALVSQREAARMAQRVRMHPRQASTIGRRGDQVVDRLAGERLAAFRSDFDSYLPKMGLKAALCRGKTWNCALS